MKPFLIILLSSISLSLFGQTIFKKGYIVNNNNDTIQGFVLVKQLNTYYETITFKNSKEASVSILAATDIKAFGFGKNNRYESNIFRNDDESIEGIFFFRMIATQKNGSIYIYENKNKASYFIKGNEGELQQLKIKEISAEQYKIGNGRYKLPNKEIIQIQGENTKVKAKTGGIYVYKKGKLYQLQFSYKNTLLETLGNEGNCVTHEDLRVLDLKSNRLRQFNQKLNKCNEKTSESYKKPLGLQLSLLMLGSTHPSSRHQNRGFGVGYTANIRSNAFSPNLSLSLNYFEYDDISTIIIYTSPPDVDDKIKRTTTVTRLNPSSYALGLNYHFYPTRNFRPFVSAEFKSYSRSRRVLSVFTDTPWTNEFFYNPAYSAQFSVGADYYFLNAGQLHFAAGYSGSLYYHLGLGVYIK